MAHLAPIEQTHSKTSMKENPSEMNRRRFLRTTATVAATMTLVPRHVLGGAKFVAPSEKVNVAIIGAGGQGRTNTRGLFGEADAQVIAVCDVAERTDLNPYYYQGSGGRKPVKAEVEENYSKKTPNYHCAEYQDFREMLEKEKAIDAVLCATPDHNHAVVSVTAMRAGKHVYCEKPLTHNVWEARQVARVAKETGVATQMGNQGHSGEGIRETCEWLWAGAIGPVREVHAWSDTGRWVNNLGRLKDTPPVPDGLNWDLWLGPRENRPYHPTYAPYNWRGWWAFGGGAIGDMACHNMDPAVWALNLGHPLSVEATSPGVDSEVVSYCAIYRYKFGQRGDMPPVDVTWYDGGLHPAHPDELDPEQPIGEGGNGVLFIGDKGKLMCGGWGGAPKLVPLSRMKDYQRPPKSLPRSQGHHRDWLAACKGGKPASSNFEYAARLTEIVLLGNVALRTGMKLLWDGPNMKATNASEADQFLKETYRSGWEIV
jgi:predicted dehydrogenase